MYWLIFQYKAKGRQPGQNGDSNAISAAKMAVAGQLLLPPADSFFLFGPPGTSKSTWLQQHCPEALRLDLLAPDVLRAYQARRNHRGGG